MSVFGRSKDPLVAGALEAVQEEAHVEDNSWPQFAANGLTKGGPYSIHGATSCMVGWSFADEKEGADRHKLSGLLAENLDYMNALHRNEAMLARSNLLMIHLNATNDPGLEAAESN